MSNVLKFFDRVQETAASISGTGTYTLAGATSGYRTFTSVLTTGDDKVPYLAVSGTIWEINLGTFTASGTTLTRDTLLSSSTGSAISWSSATPTISLIEPAAYVGLGDVLSTLQQAEISITGAVTATISCMHVCSGTSADYTVTLPAVSGNAGKLIGFRMATGLTKLVTLDGNASETLDGTTTRVMWAKESAVLLCDGSNWFKIAGKSCPMIGKIRRTTAMAGVIANTVHTKITLATSVIASGITVDTGNNRITATRPGLYLATGVLTYDNLGASNNAQSRIHVNDGAGGGVVVAASQAYSSSWYPASVAVVTYDAVVGDFFELWAYQASGVDANIYAADVNWLTVVEAAPW